VSGSWLVRDNLLCGTVISVYDHKPYVHMLTAEKMMADIAAVTKVDPVRVATEEDIRDLLLFEMAAS